MDDRDATERLTDPDVGAGPPASASRLLCAIATTGATRLRVLAGAVETGP